MESIKIAPLSEVQNKALAQLSKVEFSIGKLPLDLLPATGSRAGQRLVGRACCELGREPKGRVSSRRLPSVGVWTA